MFFADFLGFVRVLLVAALESCCVPRSMKMSTHLAPHVWDIPLTCKESCIGQTGRCVDDRLRENDCFLNPSDRTYLSRHRQQCGCVLPFSNVRILGRGRGKLECEILEAYHISMQGDNCVSTSSLSLMHK